MTQHFFESSYAKLSRAEHFICELKCFLSEFSESNPVAVKFVMSENGSPGLNFSIQPIGLLPGVIVGDAIHNMRAALDLMACDLVRAQGRSVSNVYFPFGQSKETLEDAIQKKNFHKAGQEAVDLLREIAPFAVGGNVELRAIHDLDIQDKHVALIFNAPRFEVKYNASYNLNNPLAGQGTATAIAKYIFPKDTVYGGREVLPVLDELLMAARDCVARFEQLCIRQVEKEKPSLSVSLPSG
jgi:hypothetical protein